MQSSDCLRRYWLSKSGGQFCFCNSIPIKAIPAPIPNPYLRQFDSDDNNSVNKSTSEKSRIIVLIILTLLVCHLLAPRGSRLVGNKRGHSY